MNSDTVLATAVGLGTGALVGAAAHRARALHRHWERDRARFRPELLSTHNLGKPLAALSARALVGETCAATLEYRRTAAARTASGSDTVRPHRDQMRALIAEYQLRTRRYVLRKLLSPRHRREWRTLVRGWFRIHHANIATPASR